MSKAKIHDNAIFYLISIGSTLFLIMWFLTISGQKDLSNIHLSQQVDSLIISNNELHEELHLRGINNFDVHKLTYDSTKDHMEETEYLTARIGALKILGVIFGFVILFILLEVVTSSWTKPKLVNTEQLE